MRLGFLTNNDETKNSGAFEKPQTPFNVSLAFVGSDHRGVAYGTGLDIRARG